MNELIVILTENDFYLDFDDEVAVSQKRSEIEKEIFQNFKKNKYKTLLELVLNRNNNIFSKSLTYFLNITKIYINELTKIIDNSNVLVVNIVVEENTICELLDNKIHIIGDEYLTKEFIINIIQKFNDEMNLLLKNKTIAKLFEHYNYKYIETGRIIFNLVISKENEFPFAFLATYQTGEKTNKKIVPLKQAIIEYKNDNKALLSLLSTMNKASTKSTLIQSMVNDKSIYLPVKFDDKDAYTFLKEVELYEDCGILCRIPDFWKKKSRKIKASMRIGSVKGIDLNDLLNVETLINIGGVMLSVAEARELLKTTEGLAFIKGKWVEVKHDKLNKALIALEKASSKLDANNLSLIDALKLELNPDKLVDNEYHGLIEVTNGEYVNDIINSLIFPENIKSNIRLPKIFKADLRKYQTVGLEWLEYMKKLKLGACLADDMGLGKTIQILAFLSNRLDEKTLLIVPASLISNWLKEFDKFLPNIKVNVLHPFFSKYNSDKNNIYITTYNLISKYEYIMQEEFDNVIVDEAQNIKNTKTKQSINVREIKSRFRIALTGTPIENRLSDLYSLFDFLNSGLLGTSSEFTTLVKKMEDNNDFKKLKDIISPFILRRLKIDKKIISDLPEKLENKNYITLTEKQKFLYDELVKDLTLKLLNTEEKNIQGAILPMFIKFKQICNHPAQYLDNADYNELDSGKFMLLKDICMTIKEKREKVLIFTQFKEIIPYLDKFLNKILGKGLVIHGATSVKKRGDYVSEFNNNHEIRYMILSLKAGGVGLNLTGANHVIHFDRWWNPAVENQATDRAFRIGQNKNVNVYKFICSGTIEEKIDDMIESKMTLASEIITPSEKWIGNMSKDDIISLFRLEEK